MRLIAMTAEFTRRTFCRGTLTLLCAAPLVGCAEEAGESEKARPTGTALDEKSFALLVAMMDALIPPGAGGVGATAAGAASYLAELLNAFEHDPPRVFAGGPYSGRRGGLDGFSDFQPLTRVEEIRWRTTIEGSLGLPEREFNGPVVGLRQRYVEGLAQLDASAGGGFQDLSLSTRQRLVGEADEAFVQMVYEHACEGTYGDPVYGGNVELKGWSVIHYEGDRQPLGYSARELLTPELG